MTLQVSKCSVRRATELIWSKRAGLPQGSLLKDIVKLIIWRLGRVLKHQMHAFEWLSLFRLETLFRSPRCGWFLLWVWLALFRGAVLPALAPPKETLNASKTPASLTSLRGIQSGIKYFSSPWNYFERYQHRLHSVQVFGYRVLIGGCTFI